MIYKIVVKILLVPVFLLISSYSPSEPGNKDEILMQLISEGLKLNHYQPPVLDDNFSEKVYDLYLKKLDYYKRYLTKIDVEILEQYRDRLDNQIMEADYGFFDLSAKIYMQRVEEASGYYEGILAQPFDYAKDEAFSDDFENIPYAQNKEDLKEYWRKALKYETLNKLATAYERQRKDQKEGKETEIKTFEELEAEARKKIKEGYDDRFERLRKMKESDLRTEYINSITNVFDPHTGYFPPKQKQDFDIGMSGQLEGIGARLLEKEGYVTVTEVVVGGPASKQGELKEEDKILKVAQGEEEAVNVVDMSVDEAIMLIRGKKGTKVRLYVRHVDGTEAEVPIVRDVIRIEETYAKSVILDEDKVKGSIGYIYLPKFYANFEDPRNGRRCAVDVAKELEKLKSEKVDGVILDLRNNGGGSLQDVVEMAGLFIEEGPIVQVKARRGRPYILKDEDKKVQYQGPLVVLVNTFSASASEIMAAAIQDYDRGVIIGSPSTFGKGTVQRFFELDRFAPRDVRPLGAMKLTIQKFYRINGGATQRKGVIPDIVLPYNYSYLDIFEKDQDFAMPWDEIDDVPYETWDSKSYDLESLQANSKLRVDANATFSLIEENALRLKAQQEDDQYSLNFDTFMQEIKEAKEISEKYKDLTQDIEGFHATALQVDPVSEDEKKRKKQEDWITNLEKDPYVYEAFKVMQDMLMGNKLTVSPDRKR